MGFFLYGQASAAELPPGSVPNTPTYQVGMTAYNAVAGQTDSTPDITASGAFSDPDIVTARSRDLADELPFGTVIAITAASSSPSCGYDVVKDLIGLRVIADTMNARMHNKIDVMLAGGTARSNPARTLGVCDVEIKVVGYVDIADMPKDQTALQAAVGISKLASK